MQITKKQRRKRRATKTRAHIRRLGVPRLTVHRTPQHMYAQVVDDAGGKVLVAASTVQEAVAKDLKSTGNIEAAKVVGRILPNAPRPQAFPRSHSIVPVSCTTAGFRRWRMPRVKPALSFRI